MQLEGQGNANGSPSVGLLPLPAGSAWLLGCSCGSRDAGQLGLRCKPCRAIYLAPLT